MMNLLQDLKFAVRQMRRSPGFAGTAVLILGLGIAANVIVFGVLEALLLRPLNVPQGERVLTLAHRNSTYPIFSFPEVRDIIHSNAVFSAVGAWTVGSVGLEANGLTRPVWGMQVSGQYFEVVEIKPFLGRLLQRQDDDHPGGSEAAVLTWTTWNNNFGADPNVVGKVVRINKRPYTIVGVAPQGFYGTEKFLKPDIFVPLAMNGVDWVESRREKNSFAIARMKEGVSLADVQANLDTVAAEITRQYPKEEDGLKLKVTRPGLVGDFFGGPARRFLAGVMALAGIVLLAACANLGGLFAARTADRTREIAIRLAVGSSRWRVVRQVLIEAFVISLLGGACACGLAWMALSGLTNWHPPTAYPFGFTVQPRPILVVVTLLISALAGVLFGVMPLRQIFKADPNDAIKGGGQATAGRRWALRDVLLAAQIALCCVTVTAAFVALRGFSKSLTMDLGFNPKSAVQARLELNEAAYTLQTAEHFQRELLDRVSQMPGVDAAGYADSTPLNQDASTSPVFSQQTSDFRRSNRAFITYNYLVSPGYLTAAQTPLIEGRDLSFNDKVGAPPVAVVNLEFVRRLFHSDHAVGSYYKDLSGHSIQIVGIVANGKYLSLSEDQEAVAFTPILQKPTTKMALVVRTRRDLGDMGAAVRAVVHDMDPGIPLRESGPWANQLGLTFFPTQVATVALGIFGAFGLLLSITGTFGLASYTVSKRLRELSIRVALGAQAKQIFSAALGRMLILLGTGSLVGLMLGVAASRVLSAIVYQASAQDPFVLVAVAATVLLTGSLSVAGPVRRALQVDPAHLLREQ